MRLTPTKKVTLVAMLGTLAGGCVLLGVAWHTGSWQAAALAPVCWLAGNLLGVAGVLLRNL